jgi:hypothetical protein
LVNAKGRKKEKRKRKLVSGANIGNDHFMSYNPPTLIGVGH